MFLSCAFAMSIFVKGQHVIHFLPVHFLHYYFAKYLRNEEVFFDDASAQKGCYLQLCIAYQSPIPYPNIL